MLQQKQVLLGELEELRAAKAAEEASFERCRVRTGLMKTKLARCCDVVNRVVSSVDLISSAEASGQPEMQASAIAAATAGAEEAGQLLATMADEELHSAKEAEEAECMAQRPTSATETTPPSGGSEAELEEASTAEKLAKPTAGLVIHLKENDLPSEQDSSLGASVKNSNEAARQFDISTPTKQAGQQHQQQLVRTFGSTISHKNVPC
jgi:hypothetical protein